jgi:hypothetical protein
VTSPAGRARSGACARRGKGGTGDARAQHDHRGSPARPRRFTLAVSSSDPGHVRRGDLGPTSPSPDRWVSGSRSIPSTPTPAPCGLLASDTSTPKALGTSSSPPIAADVDQARHRRRSRRSDRPRR